MNMEDFEITAADEAAILAAADAAGSLQKAKVAKVSRPRLTASAWILAEGGVLPNPLCFPVSNYWSQSHADKLHALALQGDAEGLAAYVLGGTNTYAKALRDYRLALLTYLQVAGQKAADAAAEGPGFVSIGEVAQTFAEKMKAAKAAKAAAKASGVAA
jgi:hypothetical protein